jgi:hypothetical protein
MAELDTSIPLGIKVPEYDPMGDAYKLAQMRNAQQSYQANNLALQEKQRSLGEQEGLRNLLASGVDPLSPEGQKQAFMIAPNLGPTFVKTALDAQKAQRDSQAAATDLAVKNLGYARSLMPGISNQDQLDKFLGYINQNVPNVAANIPTSFDEFSSKRDDLMKTADQALQRHFYETEQAGPNGPIKSMQSTNMYGAPQGTATVGSVQSPVKMDINTDATGAVSAINPYNATAKPVMVNPTGAAPLSQVFDPVAYDRAVRGAEGTGKNPNSSANGLYQFTDGTFVDMFKKTFPEGKGMSNSQILAMRGSTLPNGQKVEEVLGPAFTAQNAQYLQSKSLPVNGATVYLAHFLGPQGAEKLLKADPNTPVSQVVNQDAIDANKSILQGKTVGQVQQWAANLIDKKGGTIGTASGALPAFSQPQAGPTFAQPGATGGPVTGGGAVTAGGYVPPQVGMNALAPQQTAQNALLQQNQPTATTLTPYQMQINKAPAQPVAPVEAAPQQLGAGSKAQQLQTEQEIKRQDIAPTAAATTQAARETAFPAANASVNNITQNASELLRDLEALKNHPGLSNITGLINATNTPNISPDARNAAALLDRIKSQGTLSTLNALRAESEGTGAAGLRITNKDVGLLEQAFGTLNPSQSTPEMKKSIQNAIDKIKNITGNVTQEFNDKYSYRGAKAPEVGTKPNVIDFGSLK